MNCYKHELNNLAIVQSNNVLVDKARSYINWGWGDQLRVINNWLLRKILKASSRRFIEEQLGIYPVSLKKEEICSFFFIFKEVFERDSRLFAFACFCEIDVVPATLNNRHFVKGSNKQQINV